VAVTDLNIAHKLSKQIISPGKALGSQCFWWSRANEFHEGLVLKGTFSLAKITSAQHSVLGSVTQTIDRWGAPPILTMNSFYRWTVHVVCERTSSTQPLGTRNPCAKRTHAHYARTPIGSSQLEVNRNNKSHCFLVVLSFGELQSKCVFDITDLLPTGVF